MISWILVGVLGIVVFLLLWYVKNILSKLVFISNNFEQFEEKIDSYDSELASYLDEYRGHLEILLEAEILEDDPLIQNFVKHTKVLLEDTARIKDDLFKDLDEFKSQFSVRDIEEVKEEQEQEEIVNDE